LMIYVQSLVLVSENGKIEAVSSTKDWLESDGFGDQCEYIAYEEPCHVVHIASSEVDHSQEDNSLPRRQQHQI